MSCYIQKLEQVKDGWHIRFGGSSDLFWTMLSNFKAEQKRCGQIFCHYNPRLFSGQGGWFCADHILIKYGFDFENYIDMRQKAELVYAEEAKRKEREEELKRFNEETIQKERERARRQREQERSYQQRPTRPPSTALTLTEAKVELGLSPLAQLTEKEVKKAFRLKAMEVHPDHGGSHMGMVKLNQAYQLVMFHVVKVGVR